VCFQEANNLFGSDMVRFVLPVPFLYSTVVPIGSLKPWTHRFLAILCRLSKPLHRKAHMPWTGRQLPCSNLTSNSSSNYQAPAAEPLGPLNLQPQQWQQSTAGMEELLLLLLLVQHLTSSGSGCPTASGSSSPRSQKQLWPPPLLTCSGHSQAAWV
jgi:hypothetical protein